jgi:hypothetical protein
VLRAELVFGFVLVALLLFLGLFYGRRQVRALRGLNERPALPDEEMRHERGKARRRLVSCVLLLAMAGLLTVVLALAGRADRLAEERKGLSAEEAPALSDEQRAFVRFYGWTVVAFLVLLMAVVLLAGADLWSTRRYGLKQLRKLQADRRAMIERQVLRMRQDRNGEG